MIDPMPADIFQPGQILNNTYEILGVLGRGGTGEVYQARNLITGRVVAIKALNQQFSGNDDYVGLMRREEQMRDVLHDAVVRYSECSRSDQGHVFLVMDFVDGPSLADLMATQKLDPRDILIIAHRIAEGLVAAHGHGIVHRDLSPDNVILRGGSPERATIIDFGIAKDTAAGAKTIVGNDFAGKYEYAAPEQLDGKAEPRSDLYSLGALMLAIWRGAVPFSGSTPGEMVRRKQQPLDTSGVPEPLKAVIDWLTRPDAKDRPARAEDVVARIDSLLRPMAKRSRAQNARAGGERERRRPGGAVWLGLLAALVLALGGVWYGGGLDRLFVKPLPVATPYRLAAQAPEGGPASLTGNAPDADSATAIARAFATASGAMPPAGALTLAAGVPTPEWPAVAAKGLAIMQPLQDWHFELSDTRATISGLAPDKAGRAAAMTALGDWAKAGGISLTLDLATGPRDLPATAVSAILTDKADCGPLALAATSGPSFGLADTIAVTGNVARPETAATVKSAIEAIAGDRQVRVDATPLNDAICTLRSILPKVAPRGVSIWLGDGKTQEERLTGVFHVGEFPAVEVRVPATLSGLSLWVGIADVSGNVINILPNAFAEETALDQLGTAENGVRTVKVMPVEYQVDGKKKFFALQVDNTNFGKSEFIAILTRRPLFDIRRPKDESVASFTQALNEILAANHEDIVAIATRLLDSRP